VIFESVVDQNSGHPDILLPCELKRKKPTPKKEQALRLIEIRLTATRLEKSCQRVKYDRPKRQAEIRIPRKVVDLSPACAVKRLSFSDAHQQ
jgi:hypothetical protein